MKTQKFPSAQPTASQKERKTDAQVRTESIQKKFADKTDRQLLEEQVHLNQLRNDHIKSIKNNVQFFFWITLVSIIGWAFMTVISNN